jgi:hypothetical protein
MHDPTLPSSIPSLRTAARIAGVGYLAIFALAIYANFAVRMRLIDPDDAATTVRNLAESEIAVRLAIAAFVVIFILDVVIAWALYVLFRPTGPRRALHAAWFRLTYTVFLGVACVFLFLALRLSTADVYRDGLDPVQADSTAMLALDAFDYTWLVGLAAFGIHLILVGRIIVTSRVAPALLGWTLAVAGAAYVADTFAHTLLTDYQSVAGVFLVAVAVPSMLGELAFTIWLLARAGRAHDGIPRTDVPNSGTSTRQGSVAAGERPSFDDAVN